MSTPKMPKNTCPAIDSCISLAKWCEENASQISSWARDIKSEIEDLREQNAQLRDCAIYWQARVDALEAEIIDLQGREA